MRTRSLSIAGAIFALVASAAQAAEGVDYLKQVKPILTARCFACHGALQQKAALRLDTAKLMHQGSDNGPVVVAGKSHESLLLERVGAAGKRRMPPPSEGEGLTPEQIALLKNWIDQGAPAPADEKAEPDPREHWAFHSPVRPPIPVVKNTTRVRNAVDAFLAAEWEQRGLSPQPTADKGLLLRRVYLDLIGLPPTRAEIDEFRQAYRKPSAGVDPYEKVVDRLLASKQYGERWGRHWMDVWRYSDWWGLGAEVRNSQKHMWHWRDWILESLNADKGYDQMVREMLAADELYPNDFDKLRATGFLVRHYFIFNHNSWMDETVEHTSKAFLGLTLNCAKCHDHKYDPIAQADYYRFRAFFEPYHVRLEQVPGEADYEKDAIPCAFDLHLDRPTYRLIRGDEKNPDKKNVIRPGLPPLLSFAELKIEPVPLPVECHTPGLRPYVLENQLRAADKRIAAARAELEKSRTQLAEAEKASPPKAAVATGSKTPAAPKPLTVEQAKEALVAAAKALLAAEAQPGALAARGAADRARLEKAGNARDLAIRAGKAERQAAFLAAEESLARAEVELLHAAGGKPKDAAVKKRDAAQNAVADAARAMAAPNQKYTPLPGALKAQEMYLEPMESRLKPFPTTSSGRRSAFARWLTDRRNPLTARVAVNHMWLRHFGKPLVPSVFDFGRKGLPPTHPALLDYLAVELMDKNWSMKHLHRLMVTSHAYRMSSSSAGAAPGNLSVDPENRFYWHMNPVRMEAQVVRDSLLHLAGELDTAMGGPSIPANEENSRRRSLYFVHSHNEHQKFLSLFDDADVLECYRRSESIVPQQALALSNSRFALTMAGKINARLHEQLGNSADSLFVRAAFETVLSAVPTPPEQAACEQALAQLRELLKNQGLPDVSRRARGDLVQALLNHNDFITIR